jgi:hypothetical protein
MTPYLPRLRELNLTLYAPLLYTGTFWKIPSSEPIQTLPINDYLRGFTLNAILSIVSLERLSITGFSGDCNKTNQIIRNNNKIIENGDSGDLIAVLDLCRQIKHGFIAQKRNVVVKACLQYAVDKRTEETFE